MFVDRSLHTSKRKKLMALDILPVSELEYDEKDAHRRPARTWFTRLR